MPDTTTDLLQRLKHSHATIGRTTINGVEIGLRVLTEADYAAAQLAALEVLKSAKLADVTLASAELLESAKSLELLARATVDLATGERLFKSASEVGEVLTRDQKEALTEAYLAHEQSCSPRPESMAQAEVDALIEELKKKRDMTGLSNLSIAVRNRLILSLADRLWPLAPESGSTS